MIETNYKDQKKKSFAYFKVNKEDFLKINSNQYTLYDFITNCFSFSRTKKDITMQLLLELRGGPKSFKEMQIKLNLKKSTLFLLVTALTKSGLIEYEGKKSLISLSPIFSEVLKKYAEWWVSWVEE
ncbi:MAG: hypothetical protein ABH803_01625 [Candidatus Micrarchaeota archaeon]